MKKEFGCHLDGVTARHWGEREGRQAAIEQYLMLERPSVYDADFYAAKLELSRRSFYRIVRDAKRDRPLAGAGRRGVHAKMDQRVRAIIDEVVAELWPANTLKQIFRICVQRCSNEALAPPSLASVRRSLKAPIGAFPMADNLDVKQPFILDASPLNVDALSVGGIIGAAVLWALFLGEDGSLLTYGVLPRFPTPDDIRQIAAILEAKGFEPNNVAAAALLRRHDGYSEPVPFTGSIRNGEGITARFGAKLGRLMLLPHRRTCYKGFVGAPVPLEALRRKLDECLSPSGA